METRATRLTPTSRLITVGGGATASFVYDGDGNRVRGTVEGVTTAYVGNYFEWTGSAATMVKYYYAGGQRVALRVGNPGTLNYLLTDHLGSQAITADVMGVWAGEVRYKAWGEDRPACALPPCGTTPTSFRYTGQRHEAELGLYYYGARWYDPSLSRFIQPDVVVPAPNDPQQLNRFAYTRNNPLRFVDPTGHELVLTSTDPDYIQRTLDILNAGLWGYEVSIDDKGVVSISAVDVEGQASPEQQAMYDYLSEIINDKKRVTVAVELESPPAAFVDNFDSKTIYLSDIESFGPNRPEGGASSQSLLMHSLEEQYQKQVKELGCIAHIEVRETYHNISESHPRSLTSE